MGLPGRIVAATTSHTLRALEHVIGVAVIIFQDASGVEVVSPDMQFFFSLEVASRQCFWSPAFHIHSIALSRNDSVEAG
jgi:hypothetical protein